MNLNYTALTSDGSAIKGKGAYDSIQSLFEDLASQDMILLKYTHNKYLSTEEIQNLFLPKVKRPDIVEFCDSLSSMVGSGLPLIDSIESIKDTIKIKRLRIALEKVIMEVKRGSTLSGAFAESPTVFPDILIFFCNIGEETGTLQDALKNTAEHLKKVDDIVSQTKRALIYPAFVISAMGAVMFFWLFFVLPRLVETFHDINVTLPDITMKLVKFVAFSRQNWYIYPGVVLVFMALIFLMRRFEPTKIFLAHTILKIPIAGELLKYSSLTIFFSNMALMLRSGVTLTRTFEVLETTFKNPAIKSITAKIRQSTSSGNSLLDAFTRAKFFDAITLRMISVGESTGTLDQRLNYLADTYQEKTSRFVDVMGKMIEPIVMALSGGLFVFIVVSLIGPVYDLVSQLGGG